MDFRKTFEKIPEEFDKFRLRYCEELFQEVTEVCGLNETKRVLDRQPNRYYKQVVIIQQLNWEKTSRQ